MVHSRGTAHPWVIRVPHLNSHQSSSSLETVFKTIIRMGGRRNAKHHIKFSQNISLTSNCHWKVRLIWKPSSDTPVHVHLLPPRCALSQPAPVFWPQLPTFFHPLHILGLITEGFFITTGIDTSWPTGRCLQKQLPPHLSHCFTKLSAS